MSYLRSLTLAGNLRCKVSFRLTIMVRLSELNGRNAPFLVRMPFTLHRTQRPSF